MCKVELSFLLSFGIVAWGQPARIGWLGALAAVGGYALFFSSLPPSLSKSRKFFLGSLWFAAIQMVQLSWMTSIAFQGYYILFVYVFLCVGIGCQFGLLTSIVSSRGNWLRLLCGAALWTLIEWARLFFICGFSWNPIGLALTHFSFSLQFASLFGIFGLSFWVMLTNLVVLRAWHCRTEKMRWVQALVLVGIPYLFGAAQLAYHEPKSWRENRSISVALFQTGLLPSEKMPHPGRMAEFISPFVQWKEILRGLKAQRAASWDLIVLPEAAVPLPSSSMLFPFETVREILIAELGPEVEKEFPVFSPPFAEERVLNGYKGLCVSNLFWCQTIANYFKAELAIGLDHADESSKNNYNSLFFCQPYARSVNRYDKQVLLPLAEYLPFDFLSPFVKSYGIADFFTHGSGAQVLGEKNLFSPSICYEETFPGIMREGRVKGAKLFVNITNDNYYPDSSLHEQHLYHARVRAVENGIPLVRSCNSGVSAAVDCFGRIVSRMEDPRYISAHPEGVLNSRLNAYVFPTLYTFWGEGIMMGSCAGICLLFWASRRIYRFRFKRTRLKRNRYKRQGVFE